LGSYGHTGFTGTSIWIDPASQTYVILLSNSVHPFRRPAITELRAKVATIAAAAIGIDVPGVSLTGYNETVTGPGARREIVRNAETLTGLDVLEADNFQIFKGKRVGLITNQTGHDRSGRRNIDVMLRAGVNLIALFSRNMASRDWKNCQTSATARILRPESGSTACTRARTGGRRAKCCRTWTP
jgi:hypothetical protein